MLWNSRWKHVSLLIAGSGVTGGGGGRGAECPPETSDQESFADVSGKKRQGNKGKGVKIEKKRRKIENWKREGGKLKMEVGKVLKRVEDLLFCFCFCFFFFCFSLLKTTEICLGTKMGIFNREKAFHAGKKKSGKMTLPPQKNMPVTPLIAGWGERRVTHIFRYMVMCCASGLVFHKTISLDIGHILVEKILNGSHFTKKL